MSAIRLRAVSVEQPWGRRDRGAGLTVVEQQRNLALTCRPCDHGRDRALQVDAAVAAAKPMIDSAPVMPYDSGPGQQLLVEGRKFVVECGRRNGCYRRAGSSGRRVRVVSLTATGIDGMARRAGMVPLAASLAVPGGVRP